MYQINFNDWIYNVGPDPTGTLNFQTSQTMAATNLANAYIYGNYPTPAQYSVYHTWSSNVQVVFVDTLNA